MIYLDIATLIIPGFDSLSRIRRTAFEESAIGIAFSSLVNETITAFTKLESSLGWWDVLVGSTEKKKQSLGEQFNKQKEKFIKEIKESNEYQTIILWITFNTLKKEFPEFKLLGKKQQKILAKANFSHELLIELSPIDRSIPQKIRELLSSGPTRIISEYTAQWVLMDELDTLKDKRQHTLDKWNKTFLELAEMAPLRYKLAKRREITEAKKYTREQTLLNEHAGQLASFFPLLYYRESAAELPIIEQLRIAYLHEDGKLTSHPEEVDQQYLTSLLFNRMREINQIEIAFINLDEFNRQYAKKMAIAILKNFNDKIDLEINLWFDEYENELYRYTIEQLHLIDGSGFQTTQVGIAKAILHSLSFLFNNKALDTVKEFTRKLGDAHAFIQATGFSTQNENSYLAILDLYNYGRYVDHIAETKSIITSLLSPLQPLYEEYKNIAFYERNSLLKIVRTLMPILITAAFIILIAVMCVPLALPELAFAVAFIPAFLIGIILAAKYVSVKNNIYKSLCNYYYGGPFEIPEFQMNDRMLLAFRSQENALMVRKFYIEKLTYCDEMESVYRLKYEPGTLTQEEIEQRKENSNKRHQLCLEWYDIHSNKELGFADLPKIVLNRLQKESDEEYQHLESVLQNELDSIRSSIRDVTMDLKTTMNNHSTPPAMEPNDREATIIKTQYIQGLFSPPRCLLHKTHIEDMVSLSKQIRSCL